MTCISRSQTMKFVYGKICTVFFYSLLPHGGSNTGLTGKGLMHGIDQ